MTERVIGYARSAQQDDGIQEQIDALNAAGCDEVFVDNGTSGLKINPGLKRALAALNSGDVLKVTRLDRLTRSMSVHTTILTTLLNRHVHLIVLDFQDSLILASRCHALNYGSTLTEETPLLRKIAYRIGRFLILLSGRGAVLRL